MSAFTTVYAPTSVSTFEDVTVTETGFEDGTARFNGFVVEEITDGIEDSRKAAKLQTEGTVTLINTSDGLILTGFYLKSDADVTISASKGQLEISTPDYSLDSGSVDILQFKRMGRNNFYNFK